MAARLQARMRAEVSGEVQKQLQDDFALAAELFAREQEFQVENEEVGKNLNIANDVTDSSIAIEVPVQDISKRNLTIIQSDVNAVHEKSELDQWNDKLNNNFSTMAIAQINASKNSNTSHNNAKKSIGTASEKVNSTIPRLNETNAHKSNKSTKVEIQHTISKRVNEEETMVGSVIFQNFGLANDCEKSLNASLCSVSVKHKPKTDKSILLASPIPDKPINIEEYGIPKSKCTNKSIDHSNIHDTASCPVLSVLRSTQEPGGFVPPPQLDFSKCFDYSVEKALTEIRAGRAQIPQLLLPILSSGKSSRSRTPEFSQGVTGRKEKTGQNMQTMGILSASHEARFFPKNQPFATVTCKVPVSGGFSTVFS